ncbi:MAG: 5-(carboxyamino)imidazole ribonucleotide synthase [Spirochaetales bacterium]|nr:5-(carboxyamino)imidazole ribonucleotide synthase [Leptospiraceae bacterium]MCP5482472.1 5-(carboxyamino)imidazole ribonucleotide synthase [Spirochaetales bacterium]MCP5485824.1 5-(carboxyamino)imidazole ribonucleotide synthase [Spirochaetales bacterium]
MRAFLDPDFHPGLLGGGQLGRMLLAAGFRFQQRFSVLDPDPRAPCFDLCPPGQFLQGALTDHDRVCSFAENLDLLTVEIENVSTSALRALRDRGVVVRPAPEVIELVQDKLVQKRFLRERGFPTADFVPVDRANDLVGLRDRLPGVLKLRRAGYDGRGVRVLKSEADFDQAFEQPALLEHLVPFEREIAVLVSRNASGEIACYDAVEMEFHPEQNLVELLFAPARLSDTLQKRARELACDLANTLGIEGLLAVEMFVHEERLLINEIAPRPHNSGHHTIEACVTSQFEQHLRAILNLPPGDPRLVQPAVMINLLGESGSAASFEAKTAQVRKLLARPGVHLHLYGKRESRPFRKMGHITVTDANLEQALKTAREIRRQIGNGISATGPG